MAIDNIMRNIIDAAREYGFFVHREDIPANDFTIADFANPFVWYDCDVSSFVPENAHAISLHCAVRSIAIGMDLKVRRKGYVNGKVRGSLSPQVANTSIHEDMTIGIGPDRIFQIQMVPIKLDTCNLVIKGWWY